MNGLSVEPALRTALAASTCPAALEPKSSVPTYPRSSPLSTSTATAAASLTSPPTRRFSALAMTSHHEGSTSSLVEPLREVRKRSSLASRLAIQSVFTPKSR